MKKILYLFLLFLPVLGFTQSRYGVEGVPMCWTTALGVDSSIIRYVLVSTTGQPVKTIVHENASGVVVNVSGGTLRYGFCDCAGGLDSLQNGSVTWAKLANPVKDSINKSVTWSRLANPVKDSIRIGMNQKRDTSISFVGNYNLSTAVGDAKIQRLYRKITLSGTGPGNKVTLTLPDGGLNMTDVDLTVVAADDTIQVQAAVNDGIYPKFRKVNPTRINEYKCVQIGAGVLWKGSVWDSLGSSSVIPAYTSFNYILDTVPATGLAANESVTNYPVTAIDSSYFKFTNGAVLTQRGGWLANGTSGDSVAVTVPFGVVFGNSIMEGHPGLHGRLHPNGVAGFLYNYPDSTGQLSYHLERLTYFPWFNQGIGGQTSDQCLRRFDRDVLAQVTNPTAGADSRGTKTLNRKPMFAVIEVGINDVFTAGFNAERTKANLLAMAQKASQAGIYTVMLTLPGDEIMTALPQDKYIQEVNNWMKSGALNQFGTVICDFNNWWRDPEWNDNFHANSLIFDDIHPSKVGYDSLANFIYRTAKLPRLRAAIVYNERAPVDGLTGFSRPTSISIHGTPYTLANSIDSAIITAPLTGKDSIYFKITASTNVSGTSYSGFSHIEWVLRNSTGGLYQRSRFANQISYLEINGSGSSATMPAFVVKNSNGTKSLQVNTDGSVWNWGKNGVTTNTFFGQEAAQGNVSGSSNAGFGQYALFGLTSGSNNSGFGPRALFSVTTGGNNVAVGTTSLNAVTTGSNNTALGHNAANKVTTAQSVTAVGSNAFSNITGAENVGIGEGAGSTATTSQQITVVGTLANWRLTTGNYVTSVGYRAASEMTTGNYNVAVGHNAARYQSDGATALQTPTNSTYVGSTTKGTQGATNENVFGYNATGNGSNTVTIGDANVTDLFTGAEIFTFGNGLKIYTGVGTPEGAVTAPVGSMFLRSDGGAGTSFYIKESGSGNTGWVAK